MLGSIVRKTMPITESRRQSDLEKRLKILRQQVYGKKDKKPDYQGLITDKSSVISDITYLRQDLFKILTLSSIAIGAQLILLFFLKNHILNLNLF